MMGLELWEFRLWAAMQILRLSLKRKENFGLLMKVFNLRDMEDIAGIPPAHLDVFWLTVQRSFAAELGQFIADELLRPNYQVLRIAAEGWENLNSGKPFKNKPGKPVKRMCVMMALSDAIELNTDRLPSLDEIIAELAKQTPPVSMLKSQVIRVLETMGLKECYRDTRRADEDPKLAK